MPLGRIGVVFDRPLPYVYLAREVFAQGGVPFDARDALPLGAEPFAAAVDLVLACAAARSAGRRWSRCWRRRTSVSPRDGERPIDRLDVAALDAALENGDHRGDADRLDALAEGWIDGTLRSRFARWDASAAARAARAGAAVIRELAPLDSRRRQRSARTPRRLPGPAPHTSSHTTTRFARGCSAPSRRC